MKRKIIRSFFAVYLALSMAYGGARAAYLTVTAAMAPPNTSEETVIPSSFGIDTVPAEPKLQAPVLPSPEIPTPDVSAAAPSDAPEISSEPSPAQSASDEEEAYLETPESESDEEESYLEAPEAESNEDEAYLETPETESDEEEAYLEAPETESDAEEAYFEASETESDEEEAQLEAAPAQDVPTLEDYLSGLHCGHCGRNCYLSSPRCRTGQRRAAAAEEEYYAEYGISEDM